MRCFRNPATIHAICEDYRPGAEIDLEMDEADVRAGRHQDSMTIWPRYAADIRAGKAMPSGHYVHDEAPEETYVELRAFFLEGERGRGGDFRR